jgi:hypothetical protein
MEPPQRRVARAEHGPHPRNQLAQLEGLGQVVVRANLEADHPVDGISLAREHDDRNIVLRANLACEIEAVFLAKIEIERDQGNRVPLKPDTHLCTVLGLGNGKTLALQTAAQQGANLRLVVDN